MLFQKKIDRAMNWLKEKDKENKQTVDEACKKAENADYFPDRKDTEKPMLEKNDFAAMFFAAILVFAPIFIVLIIIIILVSL